MRLLHNCICVVFLIMGLAGCALFRSYDVILLTTKGSPAKTFYLNAYYLAYAEGISLKVTNASFDKIESDLHASGIPNIQSCTLDRESFASGGRGATFELQVSCEKPIEFTSYPYNSAYGFIKLDRTNNALGD